MGETAEDNRVARNAAIEALNCGTAATLLVGHNGRIVHTNRAADVLLTNGRAFGNAGGWLRVQRQPDQDAIEAAVSAALDSGDRGIIHLLNRQGDISHIVTVVPLPGQPVAVVCLAELRGPLLLGKHWSREALGLPLPYAELAEALAGGENLAEFATRTKLTIGGARTRLKKLLKRLGARSQADLVALLIRAAATLSIR